MRKREIQLPVAHGTTRVYLLRHGESTFNEQGRYQGCSDESVLTERGLRTAVRAGRYLKNEPPDVIFASPLRRARQTAETILTVLEGCGKGRGQAKCSLECHELLKEVNLPLWEGLTFDQVRENFGRDYRTWSERPHMLRMNASGGTPTQITPLADLYLQAARFWSEILPRWEGKKLLVVSHAGTTRALVGTALGIPARFYHRTQHSNGGLTILRFSATHQEGSRIEAMNLTGHLGRRLPKLKEGKRGVRLVLLPLDRAVPPPQRLLDELKPDFVADPTAAGWHRSPMSVLSPSHFSDVEDSVRTGVVIAPVDCLLPVLLRTTGTRPPDGIRWAMRDGHISILHYPDPDGTAVLQAFNVPVIAEAGKEGAL